MGRYREALAVDFSGILLVLSPARGFSTVEWFFPQPGILSRAVWFGAYTSCQNLTRPVRLRSGQAAKAPLFHGTACRNNSEIKCENGHPGRAIELRCHDLTQRDQQAIYFLRGVVMDEADAEEAAGFFYVELLA